MNKPFSDAKCWAACARLLPEGVKLLEHSKSGADSKRVQELEDAIRDLKTGKYDEQLSAFAAPLIGKELPMNVICLVPCIKNAMKVSTEVEGVLHKTVVASAHHDPERMDQPGDWDCLSIEAKTKRVAELNNLSREEAKVKFKSQTQREIEETLKCVKSLKTFEEARLHLTQRGLLVRLVYLDSTQHPRVQTQKQCGEFSSSYFKTRAIPSQIAKEWTNGLGVLPMSPFSQARGASCHVREVPVNRKHSTPHPTHQGPGSNQAEARWHGASCSEGA